MNFELTDEQKLLQETLARYLASRHDFQTRREIAASPAGYSRSLWRAFAGELGALGAIFPEEAGGIGGGAIDMLVIARELGRALVTSPYLQTIVIAGGILRRIVMARAADLLAPIISGDRLLALCGGSLALCGGSNARGIGVRVDAVHRSLRGEATLIHDASWADFLIVAARDEVNEFNLFLVPTNAAGITRRDHLTIDGGRVSDIVFTDVDWEGTPLATGEEARRAVDSAMDDAIVALCAEACGVMQRLLSDSLIYARQRVQFGQPISSFQVIQHRLVDMFMEVEQAEAATMAAAWQLACPPRERGAATSAAKVQVSEACRNVGQAAIQIHGGVGMTDDLALGHYFRRATVIEKQFGSVHDHLRRFARAAACSLE